MIAPHIHNIKAKNIPLTPTMNQIVHFPKGLIGFQSYQDFYLYGYGDDSFSLLESCDNPDVRFLLFHITWDAYDAKDLALAMVHDDIHEIDDQMYTIVCCGKDRPTINLRAPLVKTDTIMWQLVLGPTYSLDHALE